MWFAEGISNEYTHSQVYEDEQIYKYAGLYSIVYIHYISKLCNSRWVNIHDLTILMCLICFFEQILREKKSW